MLTATDRHGRRIVVRRIVPDGATLHVPIPLMDARAVQRQRAFLRDAALHKPGYAESVMGNGFGDSSERAYEAYKARLADAWRTPMRDDYDDNTTMGIQRADAPDDIQQMSLREQDVYVSAYNAFVEETPDGTEEGADEAARAAIEALGSQDSVEDAAAHLERVRDRIHEATKRRLEGAWRQR
jgi:hypothetical protein